MAAGGSEVLSYGDLHLRLDGLGYSCAQRVYEDVVGVRDDCHLMVPMQV